jgi:hypothetical protein
LAEIGRTIDFSAAFGFQFGRGVGQYGLAVSQSMLDQNVATFRNTALCVSTQISRRVRETVD